MTDKSDNFSKPTATRKITSSWLRDALSLVTTLALLTAAGVVLWNNWSNRSSNAARPGEPSVAVPEEPMALAGVPLRGNKLAGVAMIVFSDFQCPFCARFATDTMPILEKEYVEAGRLQIAFRHFPLEIHPFAPKAATAADCAGEQGRFWEMHDKLFANNRSLTAETVGKLATDLSLDLALFDACTSKENPAIERDRTLAKILGVSSTPIIFIGRVENQNQVRVTHVIPGAKPLAEFRTVLDKIIR